MPNLNVQKTVTYTDPVTAIDYTIAGNVTIQAKECYRGKLALLAGSYKFLFKTENSPYYPDFKYAAIKNTGTNPCFLDMISGDGHTIVEIPHGCLHELWGNKSYNDQNTVSATVIDSLAAKGNTTIEFDVFV